MPSYSNLQKRQQLGIGSLASAASICGVNPFGRGVITHSSTEINFHNHCPVVILGNNIFFAVSRERVMKAKEEKSERRMRRLAGWLEKTKSKETHACSSAVPHRRPPASQTKEKIPGPAPKRGGEEEERAKKQGGGGGGEGRVGKETKGTQNLWLQPDGTVQKQCQNTPKSQHRIPAIEKEELTRQNLPNTNPSERETDFAPHKKKP